METIEIWKDIPGYEGLYQASSLGDIRSIDRYVKNHMKIGISLLKGKIIKQTNDKDGYKQISLSKENKVKLGRIHRLVAQTFIENHENKPCVNHKNGIKDDNRVENLEWVTKSENMIHSIHILGKRTWLEKNNYMKGKTGKLCHFSKKVNQYDLQGNFIRKWDCISDIKRVLLFNTSPISLCCNGKRKIAYGFTWKF